MSILHSVARHLSALAAACFTLAAAPTQAAVVASFDPAFGPAIPNLGFRGSVTFDVPTACYALGPGFHSTGGACQITALSGQINFYNANPSRDPNSVLTTVALDSSDFPSNYVFGAYFDPATGQLAGIDSNDSDPFSFSVVDPATIPGTGINYSGSMVLYFVSGFADDFGGLFSTAAVPSATQPGVGAAYLRNCSQGEGSCIGDTSNPARLTFTVVPEPDSIALALLGAGALAVIRRRKPIAR